MKTTPPPNRQRSATWRAAQRYTPVAVACATLALSCAQVAAQQAADAQQVTVTGIRRAIETSVATKRNADSIVEAVSAEDIGKLPETSIAESLARLPGLTAQRVNGRDQVISIRGLAPKFGVTLLNGREMVSTGDNRSVEYDQFPAELINSATVYKTPDAALGAQGLSGTVNMKTISPLDQAGRSLNFGARIERNANGAVIPDSSNKGNRLSLSYVDQFANRTVGVAIGLAHLDSPNQEKYFKPWWWGNTAIWGGGFRGLENPSDPSKSPSTIQAFEGGGRSIDNKRDGVMAVLEYKPNKDLRTQVDLYYSKFRQTSQGREYQAADLGPDWSGDGSVGSPVVGGPIYSNVGVTMIGNDRIATSGSIANVAPALMYTRYNDRSDKVSAIGWNTELKLADWKATADLSYSKAKRDEFVGELTASATSTMGYSSFYAETGSGFSRYTPTLDYGSPSVVLLRGYSPWGNLNGVGQAGSSSTIVVNDEMKGLRLAAKRDMNFGLFSSLEAGVNYTDRSKDTDRTQMIYALKNGTACIAGDVCAPIPTSILQSPADFSFMGVPRLVSFAMMPALASGAYNSAPVNMQLAPGRIWGVSEQVSTAFAKLGLDFQAGIPFRGNLGLQLVRTQQESTGMAWDSVAGSAKAMRFGTSYNDVLPSLNLVGEINSSTLVRFGLAKTLARPNLDDMRAGFSAQPNTTGTEIGKWSGSGGNPFLEPWRATAMDLSIEKYIGKRSYVGAAIFRKNLKTSIYKDNFVFDFTGFPNSTGITPINNNIGTLNAPINGEGGYVEGIELSASIDFGLMTKTLDGFGAVLTASHNHSNLPGHTNDGRKDLKRTIEGLSGDVHSMTFYYEKDGFQARIGQRYRSKYVAEVRGVWIDNSLSAIESERITDLQLGYAWETGSLKSLSVLLQVNNLTNTPYRTSGLDETSLNTPQRLAPEQYYEYGRRYLLGINYKY